MSKGNIDSPAGGKNSKLVGQAGFEHAKQPGGHKVHPGLHTGRGVGGADHHRDSSFGGSSHSIRGANVKLPGGQSIK